MKVLVVGAGAVGQVYARHLSESGCSVTFYVKPKYVEMCSAGLPLIQHQLLTPKGRSVLFSDFDVVSRLEEIEAQSFDQVWLCVSATALHNGSLDGLLAACAGTTIVSLQPGPMAREALLSRIPEDHLVTGMIAFLSYQSPLPGQKSAPPGVAYWFPPLSPSLFSGPPALRDQAVNLLKRGGCPARTVSDAGEAAAGPTAILMPMLAALELEGWSFRALRRGSQLRVAVGASREALAILSAKYGTKSGLLSLLASRTLLKILLLIAPWFTPFPLEPYFEYHFKKVGDQTRLILQSYVGLGKEAGYSVDALRQLEIGISVLDSDC